ncbi:MAG: hypothetical protein R2792_00630 [Saprospiraceae bacterium]
MTQGQILQLTINALPDVEPITDQSCVLQLNGCRSFQWFHTRTEYDWTNDETSIGLAASGNGNIPAFYCKQPWNVFVVATITVTPSYSSGGITCFWDKRTMQLSHGDG